MKDNQNLEEISKALKEYLHSNTENFTPRMEKIDIVTVKGTE